MLSFEKDWEFIVRSKWPACTEPAVLVWEGKNQESRNEKKKTS